MPVKYVFVTGGDVELPEQYRHQSLHGVLSEVQTSKPFR